MTNSLTLTFNHVTLTLTENIHSVGASTLTVPNLAIFKQRCQNILSGQHSYKDQQLDLDLLPCDLNINRGHLRYLPGYPLYRIYGSFKRRVQEILSGHHLYTDQQRHMYKELNIMTDSLGASTVPSVATFKQRGRKILSGHRLVYRSTDRQVQNNKK